MDFNASHVILSCPGLFHPPLRTLPCTPITLPCTPVTLFVHRSPRTPSDSTVPCTPLPAPAATLGVGCPLCRPGPYCGRGRHARLVDVLAGRPGAPCRGVPRCGVAGEFALLPRRGRWSKARAHGWAAAAAGSGQLDGTAFVRDVCHGDLCGGHVVVAGCA